MNIRTCMCVWDHCGVLSQHFVAESIGMSVTSFNLWSSKVQSIEANATWQCFLFLIFCLLIHQTNSYPLFWCDCGNLFWNILKKNIKKKVWALACGCICFFLKLTKRML